MLFECRGNDNAALFACQNFFGFGATAINFVFTSTSTTAAAAAAAGVTVRRAFPKGDSFRWPAWVATYMCARGMPSTTTATTASTTATATATTAVASTTTTATPHPVPPPGLRGHRQQRLLGDGAHAAAGTTAGAAFASVPVWIE
jgi:hypothetical protein